MAAYDVEVNKKHILVVDSSDLFKDPKAPKFKDLLTVARFVIRCEIPLGSLPNRDDKKIEAAAGAEAGKIQKELFALLDKLVEDVEKLLKEDKAGNSKAAGEAQKRVEAAEKKIKAALPEFGYRIRKAVERELKSKLGSTVKSSGSGGFKGIDLIAEFEGGTDAEFVTAYAETAKNLKEVGDSAAKKSDEEERQRRALLRSVEEELDELQEEKKKLAKTDAEIAKLEGEISKLDPEIEKIESDIRKSGVGMVKEKLGGGAKSDTLEKLKADQEELLEDRERVRDEKQTALGEKKKERFDTERTLQKAITGKSRTMRDVFEEYLKELAEFDKAVEAAGKDLDKRFKELSATAEGDQKRKLEKVPKELASLQKDIGQQSQAMERLMKQYAGSFTLPAWEKLLRQHLATLKGLKPIDAKALEQVTKQLAQEAKKL